MLRMATEGVFGADADPVIEWLPAEGYLRTEYSPVVLRPRRTFNLPGTNAAFAFPTNRQPFSTE